MFGIDFPELVVIAVVALIVIGPEHLPKVARTIGHLWGRAQRYVNGVKADISRDMALDELRKMQDKMQQEASTLEQSVSHATHDLERELNATASDAGATVDGMPRHDIIEEPQSELPVETGQKKTT